MKVDVDEIRSSTKSSVSSRYSYEELEMTKISSVQESDILVPYFLSRKVNFTGFSKYIHFRNHQITNSRSFWIAYFLANIVKS